MERLKDCNLEHCTPEQVGVKSSAITAFINEINENNLGLQSFTVVRHDKVCAQGFFKPYNKDIPHVLYSMSKSVTSTAVGFAVSEGLINLNDRVVKFFPEYLMSNRPHCCLCRRFPKTAFQFREAQKYEDRDNQLHSYP